jgi:hypothetical protein
MSRARRVTIAICWGALTHGLFVLAIAVLVNALYHGMRTGLGTLHGAKAWAVDALLVIQFPLLHSFLLTPRGPQLARAARAARTRPRPRPDHVALIASAQTARDLRAVVAERHHVARSQRRLGVDPARSFVASWVFLSKALYDAGLGMQTGYAGWLSVVRNRPLAFGDFPTHGLFRRCRQPVYLGFALVLWTGPVHTLDGLLLAMTWSM